MGPRRVSCGATTGLIWDCYGPLLEPHGASHGLPSCGSTIGLVLLRFVGVVVGVVMMGLIGAAMRLTWGYDGPRTDDDGFRMGLRSLSYGPYMGIWASFVATMGLRWPSHGATTRVIWGRPGPYLGKDLPCPCGGARGAWCSGCPGVGWGSGSEFGGEGGRVKGGWGGWGVGRGGGIQEIFVSNGPLLKPDPTELNLNLAPVILLEKGFGVQL